MRIDKELKYQDWIDSAHDFFLNVHDMKGAENAVNWSMDELNDLLTDDVADTCMWAITICKQELLHDTLEERVQTTACWYIALYEKGTFSQDLDDEEKKLIEADIDFIKSKMEVYEVIRQNEDNEE